MNFNMIGKVIWDKTSGELRDQGPCTSCGKRFAEDDTRTVPPGKWIASEAPVLCDDCFAKWPQ